MSGVWLGVHLRMDTNKNMCFDEIGGHAQIKLPIHIIGGPCMTI